MTDDTTHTMQKYGTENLYESAYLLNMGFKLAGKKKNGVKTTVYFDGVVLLADEDGKKVPYTAEEAGMMYYSSETKRVMDCYRSVKDFVFKP